MAKVQFLLKNTGMFERLGIMSLSSILKEKGHIVNLVLTGDLSDEEIVAKVKEFSPQILAYSIMTGEHNYHINLNHMVKKYYNAFSVFGGPHPTYMPEMIEKDSVDAICRGEGDIAFPELIDRMEQGRDIYSVPNFWFKKPDGFIVKNDLGPLVADLDNLPFPDRAIVYDVDPAVNSKGSKMFMAMRGCPYQCTYCFNHAYNKMTREKGKMLRLRSVDSIIAEIKQVQKDYFLDHVVIDDDTFLIKPIEWFEEFADKFPKEIGLEYSCNIRANLINNDRLAELLKKSGCKNVFMGVECGNNEVASNVLKRSLPNEKIFKACQILHRHKINIYTQNLVGLPIDNPLEVDLETLDLNIRLKPYFAWSSVLYPYPETEIGKLAIERGMFDANFEKIAVSNKTTSALNFNDKMLKRRIVNLHKLFGIIVQFPFLRPCTHFLISLPLTQLYTWLYFAFYGYKYVFINLTFKGLRRSLAHYIGFYFKYVANLEKKQGNQKSPAVSIQPSAGELKQEEVRV